MSSTSSAKLTQNLRDIPSVSFLIEHVRRSGDRVIDDRILTSTINSVLNSVRLDIELGEDISRDEIFRKVAQRLDALESTRMTRIINATGVILHTNLGRAPVSEETARAMANAAGAQIPLEIDPVSNARGGRMEEISLLMRVLTGADSTLVVNNNAAAVLLVLSALATGQEVIVSRGEAVEIGGGFRIPDVLRQSGAEMVEVGTTNRTYWRDFKAAITDRTAGLLTVHTSNFRVEGFVAVPDIGDLANVAREASIPLIDDLGSGSILQPAEFGLGQERTIGESLSHGVSVVTASGDKLLGGPQAGLICGRADLVALAAQHPLARAVRADKTTLAGVSATLRHYIRGEGASMIPVWSMISAVDRDLKNRADQISRNLGHLDQPPAVLRVMSTVGGGSLPGETLPSWAVAFEYPHIERLAKELRTGSPGVFGRIHDGQLLLDLRTIDPLDDVALENAISGAVQRSAPAGN